MSSPIQLIARRKTSEIIGLATHPMVPLGLFGGSDGCWTGSLNITPNRAYFAPCYLKAGDTIDQLAVRVATTNASATIKAGLYADNGSRYPAAKLLDGGSMPMNLSGFQSAIVTLGTPYVVPSTGLYWGAINLTHSGTLSTGALDTLATFHAMFFGTNAASSVRYTHLNSASLLADGNLPDPAPAGLVVGSGDCPVAWARFSVLP